MRFIAFGFLVLLVLLPSLLILLAKHRALAARMPMALLAFLSPVILFGLVSLFPFLTNDAPNAPQWAHFLGLVMWAGGFFLPWIVFALFLHMGQKTSAK